MGNAGTGGFVDNRGGTGRESECILEVGDVVRLKGRRLALYGVGRGSCGEVYEEKGEEG